MRVTLKATLVTLLSAFVHGNQDNGDMDLVLLPESTSPGGRCMDSSMAGYYLRRGADPNLFVIFLKGGGACQTKDECDARSTTANGSSDNWDQSIMGSRFLDADCGLNPDFCRATAVYVPYCTGDTHRGDRTVPSEESFGYYFDGHTNFVAIVEKLIAEEGLNNEPDMKVLLTGSSAGGIGAFFNIDWLAERLPAATVKGAPVAGWFTPAALETDLPEPFNPSSYNYFARGENGNSQYENFMNGNDYFDLYQMKNVLPSDCVDAMGDRMWPACASMHYAYPYIKSSLFNIHTQFDSNLIFQQGGAPSHPVTLGEVETVETYIEMWGEATRVSMQLILNNETNVVKDHPDGVFSASCISHGTAENTLIDGQNFMDVVHDWFFQNGNLNQYHRLVETCPQADIHLPCNPKNGCAYDPSSKLPPMVRKCIYQLRTAGCLQAAGKRSCLQCARTNRQDIMAGGCTSIPAVKQICARV